MKKFIAAVLAIAIGICIINAETDFFLHLGKYIPSAEENFPKAVDTIENLSMALSDVTDLIPSPAEFIAMIKNEELPIDPSDIASNAYIADSPMLSFYPDENVGMLITDGNTLNIFGITPSQSKKHLIANISDMSGETLDQTAISVDGINQFNKSIKIPETEETLLDVAVYAGSKPYGEFTSWVYNYVQLEKTESGWSIKRSPVYEHNKEMFRKDKSASEALRRTPSIQSENEGIKSLASKLTEGCTSDYQRILALHDWVCEYLRYDTDSVNSNVTLPYTAEEVVQNRNAVCLGFATLYASLCRSIGIPCNVVSGYALGIGADTEWTEATILSDEQNHAWNEAYVDNRWVIIDTTWDCTNKIENGVLTEGGEISHMYFDANIDFFSANHKISEYSKRR